MAVVDRPETSCETDNETNNMAYSGEGAGTAQARVTSMKTVRTRRSTDAGGRILNLRPIYAVGAGTKYRGELAQILAAAPESIVEEFAAGQDYLRSALQHATGAVVLFDPLPDIETLAIVAWLGQQRADLACIVVSAQPKIKSAVDCLKAGACDFLSLPLERPAIAAALAMAFEPCPERPNRASALARLKMTSRLSQRELQVLEGLLSGLSNKAVGAKLHISERTVEVHRSRIMRRLDVDSFAELVRMSVHAGIGSA
jgi:two-component system, LuxR family, response regulator FixJ